MTTSGSGFLTAEVLEGHGATSIQEFGLGTPSVSSTLAERSPIFFVHLIDEEIGWVTPSALVDVGFFPSGTEQEFYNLSDCGGISWAFSSHWHSTPTNADLEVFTDRDFSLGLGGSAVEDLGVDRWILHLDDAASSDDDDNEMVIRISIQPVPEPPTTTLLRGGLAVGCLALRRGRGARGRPRN